MIFIRASQSSYTYKHTEKCIETFLHYFHNNAAMIVIVKQISLTTSFMNKLNLCLIQAAAYIQQFQLEIHHKSEKQNTVSDTLSRLSC